MTSEKAKPRTIGGKKFWKSHITTSKRNADEVAGNFRSPSMGKNLARVIKEGRFYVVYVSFTPKGEKYMRTIRK